MKAKFRTESTGAPQEWHALSAEQALQYFATDPRHGLSSDEAAGRLVQYGYNRLPPPPSRPGSAITWTRR